jgi:hypothetical protein
LAAAVCGGIAGGFSTAAQYLYTNLGSNDWSMKEFGLQFVYGALAGIVLGSIGGAFVRAFGAQMESAIQTVGLKLAAWVESRSDRRRVECCRMRWWCSRMPSGKACRK